MFDTLPPPRTMQRARGRASVSLVSDAGVTRISGLHQSGSAKAFLPRAHGPVPEVVFLNTAGGLAGGDRLSYELGIAAGTRAVATTQTAERVYRAGGEGARLDISMTMGTGSSLDWLPQETILYDASALSRTTRLDMAGDGRIVIAEMLTFGRAAMGERLRTIALSDRREVWSRGLPVWIDAFGMADGALAPRPALLDGANAIATVALVATGAEDALGPVRDALGSSGVASGWNGKCVARLAADDSLMLKRAVARVLAVLRRNAPLPRVWQI